MAGCSLVELGSLMTCGGSTVSESRGSVTKLVSGDRACGGGGWWMGVLCVRRR